MASFALICAARQAKRAAPSQQQQQQQPPPQQQQPQKNAAGQGRSNSGQAVRPSRSDRMFCMLLIAARIVG